MAVGDIFHSDVYFILDDREISVSLNFYEITARTEDAQTAAGLLNAEIYDKFWGDYLQPLLSEDLTFTGSKTQMVSPSREAPNEQLLATPEVGTLTSPALNGTNAVIVAEYGDEWGARYRGRMFVPGLPESQVSAGRIETADFGPFSLAAITFYGLTISHAGDATGEWRVCTYSPAKPDAVPPLPVATSYPVTPQVRPRIGTQRRRRTKVRTTS